MDDSIRKSEIPIISLPGYDIDSRAFGRSLPVCAGRKCCHNGEGCALGYPVEWSWIENKRDIFAEKYKEEIMLIYSKEFKDYWYKAKGGEIDFPYFLLGKPEWIKTFEMQSRESEIADLILPCSHKGCSFDRCDLLQEESMMSSSYKIKRLKPSFELTKKLEEEQRLSKYLEEKEVFDAAIQEIHQLVCPNCQAVQSYKVHIPSKYKRGEIICLGCGKSLFILNPF